jgi:hypothetical protein
VYSSGRDSGRTVSGAFDDVVERVPFQLAGEGFGVPGAVDVTGRRVIFVLGSRETDFEKIDRQRNGEVVISPRIRTLKPLFELAEPVLKAGV